MEKLEARHIRRDGAIHQYFELTYANFLVLPRTVMMDMPTEWQDKFVALLEELDEQTSWRDELDGYSVGVDFYTISGRKCSIPESLDNYRHPVKEWGINDITMCKYS